ncbi:hypothetical protein BC835DRAFT_1418039 [Cytidiella melzeri]|nr:hypothetical protein BC835DRAFT_1418039 [Cytidiella melzeri]
MSTRSRPSFRRSLQSSFFRSSPSPNPSQASPPTTPSKPDTSTGKSRHVKREKVKEAIEQFFDKLHHQHHSECSHASQGMHLLEHSAPGDAKPRAGFADDSHSARRSASPASSSHPSFDPKDLGYVKTAVSVLPYEVTDVLNPLGLVASTSDELRYGEERQAEVVIEIKDDRVSATIAHAPNSELETAQESPLTDEHASLSTETSVDVMVPPVGQHQLDVSDSQPISVPSSSIVDLTTSSAETMILPPVDPSVVSDKHDESPITLVKVEGAPVARAPSPWYKNIPAIVPTYPELRQLMGNGRSSQVAVPSEPKKPSNRAGLVGSLFDNVFTRTVGFAFDMWLLVICFVLAKVLSVRPRVSQKVMSWIS